MHNDGLYSEAATKLFPLPAFTNKEGLKVDWIRIMEMYISSHTWLW